MVDQPNVYQMYVSHGGPGFWVRRTTWDATCARVVGIGTFTKPEPYYGSPPVLIDVYSLKGQLKDELALLSAPGTYKTWRQIEAPDWASTAKVRPLDDPAIQGALALKDRRQATPAVPQDRIPLKVSFAQKDRAKAIGAKWDPNERVWWIPAGETASAEKARKLGFL